MAINGLRWKKLVEVGDSPEDCWQWLGNVNKRTGYGKKQWHGKTLLAHRWIWEMLFGKIPEGKVINHLCSNRSCVNPHHLEITTQTGNCRHGAGTKLTAEAVREIRSVTDRVPGVTCRRLARKYGVTPITIKEVWRYVSWKEIQP